jgi:tripartite-type tricarboxylate transporter receptor subunit TctC
VIDRRAFCAALGGLGLAGAWPQASFAQGTYPAGPIRLLVPSAAGSDLDAIARALAQKLADNVHWSVVIDNDAAVNGNHSLLSVAKAAPDGYTLALGTTANLTINPALDTKLAVDPQIDLFPITQVTSQALLLVVPGDSKIATVKDLVSEALARPGTLRIGSAGKGTMSQLAGELLQDRAGVRFTTMPAKDLPSALKDLDGRKSDFCFANLRAVAPLLEKGRVRAVAVTSPKRLVMQPDVPAIGETYPGFDATAWTAIMGPARLSKYLVFQINIEVQHALERKDMQEFLAADGIVGVGGPPQNFGDYLRTEYFKWTALLKANGMKPQ